MASKLTPLSTSYHSFQTDQVLTETQLNEFLNYFDDQIRLSRVMLSGVGLACGFDVRYESGNRQNLILSELTNIKTGVFNTKKESAITASIEASNTAESISERQMFQNPRIVVKQGVGVTTDGDELHLLNQSEEGVLTLNTNEVAYTHYRVFEDKNAKYAHFVKDGKTVTMFELIPSTAPLLSSEEKLITTLPNVTRMVVLLYLECYQDEGDLCSGLSCDNQGIHEVANLKVLLVSQEDAAFILTKDSIYNKHDLLPTYSSLEDLAVKRVVLSGQLSTLQRLNAAELASESAIDFSLSNLYDLENEADLISQLKWNLQAIDAKIGSYLPSGLMTRIQNNIDLKLSPGGFSASHFQYKYDLLKDVIDTYNELKDQLLQFSGECFPDLTAFPKHLMLGIVRPSVQEVETKKYRHSFYKSSLFDSEMGEFKKFLFLLNRLDNQLKFSVSMPAGRTAFQRNAIRLTPSIFSGRLGNRAIPYYYDPNVSLLKTWNIEKSFQNRYGRNLSYHIEQLDKVGPVQNPLQFNLDVFDFLRIEGHQGKELVEVMTEIDKQRTDYGLAFDVKAVALNSNIEIETDYDKYACQFEDLQVMLEAWQQEQECALTKATELLSSFSIVRPGKNLQEDIIVKPIGTKGSVAITKELIDLRDSFVIPSAKSALTLEKGESLTESTLNPSTTKLAGIISKNNLSAFTSKTTTTTKAAKPVVVDSLAKESETVGAALQFGVTNNNLAEPADLIISAEYYADTLIRELGVSWTAPQRNLLITNSITLLAYARALNDSIPSSIPELNTTFIKSYGAKVKNLCLAVQKAQLDYANSEASDSIDSAQMNKNKALFNMAVNMLANTCCTIGKIQSLLDAIESRKKSILHQLLLKTMIEKHPSMEHTGGVKMGGTFILVYDSDTSLVRGVPPTKRVIADFSLPYLCCSDCAPVQFIVEQPKVKLRLPKPFICLGEEPISLIFQVEPVDGEIKPDREIDGMTIDGLTITIDPDLFPESEMGQKIDFTVNQQLTDCSLTVRKLLDATFEVPSSPISNPALTFVPVEEHPEGTNYQWSFGDGNASTLREVEHVYNFPAGEENTVVVSLTVTTNDGGCASFHTETITIVQRAITMEKTAFCEEDSNSYPIVLVPVGSGEITWNGGSGANFIPSEAIPDADGSVAISLDGEELLFVDICPVPDTKATITYTSTSVVLARTARTSQNASWSFVDDKGNEVAPKIKNAGTTVNIPIKTISNLLKNGDITALLTVANKCCEKSEGYLIKVPTKGEPVCEVDAASSINLAIGAFNSTFDNSLIKQNLTPDQFDLISDVKNAYSFIEQNMGEVLKGSLNSNVIENFHNWFARTKDELVSGKLSPEQMEAMLFLFNNLFEVLLKVIQCQGEEKYETSLLKTLLLKISSYLDKNVPDSLPNSNIVLDPSKKLVTLINSTLTFRGATSNSKAIFISIRDLLV